MADFLTSNDLNAALEYIFEAADEYLILISPFIKLHDRYASALKAQKDNCNLKIIIVFGKNENDFSKSMKDEDFIFFKDFPNIEILYEKRLHAKYYANEKTAILTSMNLYSYSQDNNIEAGVIINSKSGLLSSLAGQDSLDSRTSSYFQRVINQAVLLFQKIPQYESGMFGLTNRYTNSIIKVDKLSEFFKSKKDPGITSNKSNLSSFSLKTSGYCIRTGVEIPFNPKNPLSNSAFTNWKKFSNKDYPEKFCHFSGEKSNGETTFSRPILRKNWVNAKKVI